MQKGVIYLVVQDNEQKLRYCRAVSKVKTEENPSGHCSEQQGSLFIGALLKERCVGFTCVKTVSEETSEICDLQVAEDFRGNGIGKRMLKYAEDESRRRGRRFICVKDFLDTTADVPALSKGGFLAKSGYRPEEPKTKDGNKPKYPGYLKKEL